jgi:hypothetical protein
VSVDVPTFWTFLLSMETDPAGCRWA